MSWNLVNFTSHNWNINADPRALQWILTSTLWPIIAINVTYFAIILYILPSIFKSKKHLNYKNILATYYFIHSLMSAFFFCIWIYLAASLKHALNVNLSYDIAVCIPIIKSFEGVHYKIAIWTYIWLWFKISEMIETILIIIVYGRSTIFNLVHHTLHPFMIVICLHFYMGGTPTVFGLINNLEHAILYFIIGLRISSTKFKKKSQSWFKNFHLIISIGALILSILFFVPFPFNKPCDYDDFKIFLLICLLIFLCLSISCRWNYISHEDAFGRTKVVMWINKSARLVSNKD